MKMIKKKITISKIIKFVIILGIILRILYISYTDNNERQHDIEADGGHIAYIMHIFSTGELPESNEWQFYHPPLHHFISAVWMKILSFTFLETEQVMEALQVLPLLYTILMIIITKKILEEMKLDEKYQLLVIMIVSLHPSLILMSGSINNDCLVLLFMVAAIWYMIKWRKKLSDYFEENDSCEKHKKWKELIRTTIIFAIIMGCCVMTKVNGAVIAIPIGILFIWAFLEYFKDKEKLKKYMFILGIFGIISLLLGLWYPIRNYIKFEQGLNYVPAPGLASKCEEFSLAERFLPISKEELIDDVFANASEDHNIPAFVIKSSLFGEYSYHNTNIATIIKYVNMIIILFVIISVIRSYIYLNKKELKFERAFFLLVHLTSVIFFVYFNMKMPYGSTMDFRYIVITLFSGSILMALDLKSSEGKKYYRVYRNIIYTVTIIFSVLSIALYTIK